MARAPQSDSVRNRSDTGLSRRLALGTALIHSTGPATWVTLSVAAAAAGMAQYLSGLYLLAGAITIGTMLRPPWRWGGAHQTPRRGERWAAAVGAGRALLPLVANLGPPGWTLAAGANTAARELLNALANAAQARGGAHSNIEAGPREPLGRRLSRPLAGEYALSGAIGAIAYGLTALALPLWWLAALFGGLALYGTACIRNHPWLRDLRIERQQRRWGELRARAGEAILAAPGRMLACLYTIGTGATILANGDGATAALAHVGETAGLLAGAYAMGRYHGRIEPATIATLGLAMLAAGAIPLALMTHWGDATRLTLTITVMGVPTGAAMVAGVQRAFERSRADAVQTAERIGLSSALHFTLSVPLTTQAVALWGWSGMFASLALLAVVPWDEPRRAQRKAKRRATT